MTPGTFTAIIEERLRYVEQAMARIERGEGDLTELTDLRAYLIETLEHLERDPGIEAAADDLYAVAASAVGGLSKRQTRVLREASARFKERLSRAKPA